MPPEGVLLPDEQLPMRNKGFRSELRARQIPISGPALRAGMRPTGKLHSSSNGVGRFAFSFLAADDHVIVTLLRPSAPYA